MEDREKLILGGGIGLVVGILIGGVVTGVLATFVLGGGLLDDSTPTPAESQPVASTPTATPTVTPTATATATPTPTVTATPTPLPTPTPTATPTPTPTVTAAPTTTPTPTPRERIPPSRFDEGEIERLVAELVNERRRDDDLDPLETSGDLAGSVQEMAHNHTESMVAVGEVRHVIDGTTSADRYRIYDLYENCQWASDKGGGFAKPDANGIENSENGFETITRTVAGREYEVDGETRFNAEDRDVAAAIVNEWFNTSIPPYANRLTLPNARYIGVGVEVTANGEVYATANLC